MNRRKFIQLIALSAGALATAQGCSRKTDKELEAELLNDFLTSDNASYLEREETWPILYDIRKGDNTIARATHIGDSYFLTNSHVLENEKTSELRVLPQSRRGYLFDFSRGFEVLAVDKESDISLIHGPPEYGYERTGKARIHLFDAPSQGEHVSFFTILSGNPAAEDYRAQLNGKDFYDGEKKIENMARLILLENSRLFERQGTIMKIDEQKLRKKYFKENPDDGPSSESKCLSTMPAFNDKCGSPVFLREGLRYYFAGVVNWGIGTTNWYETPEHPLGYRKIQQAGAIFIHREPIESLIKGYLSQQQKK